MHPMHVSKREPGHPPISMHAMHHRGTGTGTRAGTHAYDPPRESTLQPCGHMTVAIRSNPWTALGGLTRSGSAVEGLSWTLYDFANTTFRFAITDRLSLIRLAPAEQVGEMFGLFGLVGKLSAVVGPLMYGGIVLILQPQLGTLAYQIAILSLLALMLIGIVILRSVPQPPVVERQP